MSDSIKALRKENEALKDQLQSVISDMLILKAEFEERSKPLHTSSSEQEKSLQYLSDEYDDLKSFKSSTEKEIKRLNTRLTEISLKVDNVSDQIDSIEQYSYNYNVKIFGIPQNQENESSSDTANICVQLFISIGAANVSLQDIDIAHRVPNRRQSDRPNPIICKFTRRLAKAAVMSKKKETRKLTAADLGFDRRTKLQNVAIYDHLTPKLQQILYKAKRFQADNNYKFCWSKSSAVFLRENEQSRVIKLKNMAEFDRFYAGLS